MNPELILDSLKRVMRLTKLAKWRAKKRITHKDSTAKKFAFSFERSLCRSL